MEAKKFTSPFDHWIIDNFFTRRECRRFTYGLAPPCHPAWVHYNNDHERKRASRSASACGNDAWVMIDMFSSHSFAKKLSDMTGIPNLRPDDLLHGGGVHVSDAGGYLGPHVDYAMHPVHRRFQRALNLIAYISPEWNREWGGQTQLYDETGQHVMAEIEPRPGRVLLFPPTEGPGEPYRFHGTAPVAQDAPPRVTMAIYYLTLATPGTPRRLRALFVPPRGQ